jgi:hypothetical protein
LAEQPKSAIPLWVRATRTESGIADLDISQRQSNDLHGEGHIFLIMAIQEGFVLVESELFSRMQQHCENCHDCNIPIQVLSDGRIVTPTDSLSISSNIRKRKGSKSSESTQNAPTNASPLTPQSETETTRLQAPSQPPGIRQSPQHNPEPLPTETGSSKPSAQPNLHQGGQSANEDRQKPRHSLDLFRMHLKEIDGVKGSSN